MKSIANVVVKSKSRKVKRKTKEELGKFMNDPTLEGKDENKVGRIKRKTLQADTGAMRPKRNNRYATRDRRTP